MHVVKDTTAKICITVIFQNTHSRYTPYLTYDSEEGILSIVSTGEYKNLKYYVIS